MANAIENGEAISALADGELHDSAFVEAIERVTSDNHALACWDTYHLIGDVLRSADGATGCDSAQFLSRLRGALANEALSRPVAEEAAFAINLIAARAGNSCAETQKRASSGRPAANAPVFAWKLVAGLASVAAVAAIGWSAMQSPSLATSGAVLAEAGQPAEAVRSAAAEPPVVLRDARLDELLRAHIQAGGSSMSQSPSGFLRNATYDAPPR